MGDSEVSAQCLGMCRQYLYCFVSSHLFYLH
jgi:hypothetical protein